MHNPRYRTMVLILCLVLLSCTAMVFARKGPEQPPTAISTASGGGVLTMSGGLSQSKVLVGGDGELTLALDLVAAEVHRPGQPLNQVDLVLVLDRSGSMAGSKIESARRAVCELIDGLGPRDRLALVSYSNSATTHMGLTTASESGKRAMRQAVLSIREGGGTNLGDGLETGISLLRQARSDGGAPVGRVVLITDGLANSGITDPASLGQMASRAAREEFTVSTVGVGEDFNEVLMTLLADRGRGNYTYLSDPATFAEVFRHEFLGARNVVASGLALSLELPESMRLLHASGYPVERSGSRVTIRPGDMVSGQARRIFLSLAMDTRRTGKVEIDQVKLTYTEGDMPRTLHLPKGFEVACVGDSSSVFASIDRKQWEAKVLNEEYNRPKEEVAREVAVGNRGAAMEKIEGYRARQETVNRTVGSDKVKDNLEREVGELSAAVDSAFAAPAAEARDVQNKTAKQLQFEGYSGRRSAKEVH